MVRKGILIGTEALVYFDLVDRNWIYQNPSSDESDSSTPLMYRFVYGKKEEEPPGLIVALPPHDIHGVHTTEFNDGPRPSAIWYTSSPIEMECTVPIYNINKKTDTSSSGELFSSAITSEPNRKTVTNPHGGSVGIAATYKQKNTFAHSPHDAPRRPLPATSPGSECVGRNRPDTGPKKPVAVLRRLEHSYSQENECTKLKDVIPSMVHSHQWQLIKVLVLQDLVNVMLPLLLEEEERSDHQPSASDRGCSANFPHSSKSQQSTEEDSQANPDYENSSCPHEGLSNNQDAQQSKPDTPVNTKTALTHIFQIKNEIFQNIYYNIMEMRSYRRAMLVTIHGVRSLPLTSLHQDGVNSVHCVLRYTNRTTETKEHYPTLSASNSICSLQSLNQIPEESVAEPNDSFTAPSKASKSSSKILKIVRHPFAKKPFRGKSKHHASCSRLPQHESSPRLPRHASSESLFDVVRYDSVCEDLVCETQTDGTEMTSRGDSCEAVWEQTFLCLTDSTTNSSLDFEVRGTKPSPTFETFNPNAASAPDQSDAVEADGAEEGEGSSLGHTSLPLKNLDTSVEQNIDLTLGEKVDYDASSPSTPSTEPEKTPSEVDSEDASTGKQIDLTQASETKKNKTVFKAIKSTAKNIKINKFFRRKQNYANNDLQDIQETSALHFSNSQSQTDPINGAAKLSEVVRMKGVAEQAKITEESPMHKTPILNRGESTDNVRNNLLPDSLHVAGRGTTTEGGCIHSRPDSLSLSDGGAMDADCSAVASVLNLSVATRDPTCKGFFCPLTPRVVIFLVHEAEIRGRGSETHPGTPFRGVIAPPLQPMVEAVKTASGLTEAQWALLLLSDLVSNLVEPRAPRSRSPDDSHLSWPQCGCNESGFISSIAGRWCPTSNWCHRAGRAVDFGYVQSLFSLTNIRNDLGNMDENIALQESWLMVCQRLLRGLLAAFPDSSSDIAALQLENCTKLAHWLCSSVSTNTSGRVTDVTAIGRLLNALVAHDTAWWATLMECYEEVDTGNSDASQSTDTCDQKRSNPCPDRAEVHLTTESAGERLPAAGAGRLGNTEENVSNEIPHSTETSRSSRSAEAATMQQVCRSRRTSATPKSSRNVTGSRLSRGRNSPSTSKRQRADVNRNESNNNKRRPFVRKLRTFIGGGWLRGFRLQQREDTCSSDSKDRSEARAAAKLQKMSQLAESVLRHLRSISDDYSPVFERNLSILYFDAAYDVIIKKFMSWLQIELVEVFALVDIPTEPLTFSDLTSKSETACRPSDHELPVINDIDAPPCFHVLNTSPADNPEETALNEPCRTCCLGLTDDDSFVIVAKATTVQCKQTTAKPDTVWYAEVDQHSSAVWYAEVDQHSSVALLGTSTPMGHIYRTVKKILRLKEQHVKQQLRDALPAFGGIVPPSLLSNIISQSSPYIAHSAETSHKTGAFSSSYFPNYKYLQLEVMECSGMNGMQVQCTVDGVNRTLQTSSPAKSCAVSVEEATLDMNDQKPEENVSNEIPHSTENSRNSRSAEAATMQQIWGSRRTSVTPKSSRNVTGFRFSQGRNPPSSCDQSGLLLKKRALNKNKEGTQTAENRSFFSDLMQHPKGNGSNNARNIVQESVQLETTKTFSTNPRGVAPDALDWVLQKPSVTETLFKKCCKASDLSKHDVDSSPSTASSHCLASIGVLVNDSSRRALSEKILTVYSVLNFNSNVMNNFKKWLLPVLLGTIRTYLRNAEEMLLKEENEDDFSKKLVAMKKDSGQLLMFFSNTTGNRNDIRRTGLLSFQGDTFNGDERGGVTSAYDTTLNNTVMGEDQLSESSVNMRNIRISPSAISLQDTICILIDSWKKLDWHDTKPKDKDLKRAAATIDTRKTDSLSVGLKNHRNKVNENSNELSASYKHSLNKQINVKKQSKFKKALSRAAKKIVDNHLPGKKIRTMLTMSVLSSDPASILSKHHEQPSQTQPSSVPVKSPLTVEGGLVGASQCLEKVCSAYPTSEKERSFNKTPICISPVAETRDATNATLEGDDSEIWEDSDPNDLVELTCSRLLSQTAKTPKEIAQDPGTLMMMELRSLCQRYCNRVHDKLLQSKPWIDDDAKLKMCVGLNNIAEAIAILRNVPEFLGIGDSKSHAYLMDALAIMRSVGQSVLRHLIEERRLLVEKSVVQCCGDRSADPIVKGALYDDFNLMHEHLTEPFFSFYRRKTYAIVMTTLAVTNKPPKDASYGLTCDELDQAFRDFFSSDE